MDYCLGIGHRRLGTLRVANVFRESCKSPGEIKNRIGQNLRESRGRLRLVGEADEVIPTMKFIGAADRATGEWIAREANEIDDTGGDWQLIETDDPSTIVFYQQRARISLTRMIADTDCLWKMPARIQERVKLGSDPVLALAPQPGCSTEEICACIGMGLASGVLRNSGAGYELVGQPGDAVFLGRDLDEIITGLRKNHDRLVALYSSFVMRLASHCDDLEDKRGRPGGPREHEPDAILPGLGEGALAQLQEVAAALRPYLRRQPAGQRTHAQPAEQDDG